MPPTTRSRTVIQRLGPDPPKQSNLTKPQVQAENEPPQSRLTIEDLTDDLLIQVFSKLKDPLITEVAEDPEDALIIEKTKLPFLCLECLDPHPGLRAYPFLSQVCKRWRKILNSPQALNTLWQELTIDFGHELITSVHAPLKWSNTQPSQTEFNAALSSARLSTSKIISFISRRKHNLKTLTIVNTKGFWSDEGEFISLANKHNFNLASFGLLLGMLHERLTSLSLLHVDDLFATGCPLSAISLLQELRELSFEELQCKIQKNSAEELGSLVKLERLCLCTAQQRATHPHYPLFGVAAIPDSWSQLTNLHTLEIRGHACVTKLPEWLTQLRHLDISFCTRIELPALSHMTALTTLGLQGLDLLEAGHVPEELLWGHIDRYLPSLDHLTNLKALNLSLNKFGAIPAVITKLHSLEILDLSGNPYLKVPQPLTGLLRLPMLRWLDLRGIHASSGGFDAGHDGHGQAQRVPALVEVSNAHACWSEGKCMTMQHVAALAATGGRRKGGKVRLKVLHEGHTLKRNTAR